MSPRSSPEIAAGLFQPRTPRSSPEIAAGLFQPRTLDVTAPPPAANQMGARC